jgi:hypothetical protein
LVIDRHFSGNDGLAMTKQEHAEDKPLTMPFSNPVADLGWDRPLSKTLRKSAGSSVEPLPSGWYLAIGLAAAFLAANFAILPLTHVFRQRDWGAVWVYLSAGLMLAQAGALSFGLVFAPGHWLYRIAAFWLAALVLFAAWGCGYQTHDWMRSTRFPMDREIYIAIYSLPLLAIVIQAPLWGLKLFAGWSLGRIANSDGKQSERPLSISDYLQGTAMVAVSLALARLAPHDSTQEFWLGWSIVGASVATVSLISVPPAMLLVLRWPRGLVGLLLMIVYTTVVCLIAVTVYWAIQSSIRVRLGGPSGWELFGFYLTLQSFAVGLSTTMLATQAFGLRLFTNRDAQASVDDA